MKAFNQTIGTGVVGGSSGTADAEELHEMVPKMGLELSSSVRSQGGWDTKTRDPAGQECWATVSVQVSVRGMTSGQRVKRSTQVSRWV